MVAQAYEFSPRGALRMWQRNATVGRKTVATSLTPRFLEAIAYLAIMGLGLGTYLTTVDGIDYVDFIAPGVADYLDHVRFSLRLLEELSRPAA